MAMRIRTVKPEWYFNEELAALPWEAQKLSLGLLALADAHGRLADRPRRIRAQIFPYHPDTDVDACLDQLAAIGFLRRYRAAGVHVILVVNFGKHQRISGREKYAPSEFPDPVAIDYVEDPLAVIEPAAAAETPSAPPPESVVPVVVEVAVEPPITAEPTRRSTPPPKRAARAAAAAPEPAERVLIREFYRELYGGAGPLFEPTPTAHELEQAKAVVAALGEKAAIELAPRVAGRLRAKWPEAKRFAAASTYWNESINAAVARREKAEAEAAAAQVAAKQRALDAQRRVEADAVRLRWELLTAADRTAAIEEQYRINPRLRQMGKAGASFAEDFAIAATCGAARPARSPPGESTASGGLFGRVLGGIGDGRSVV